MLLLVTLPVDFFVQLHITDECRLTDNDSVTGEYVLCTVCDIQRCASPHDLNIIFGFTDQQHVILQFL